MNKIISIVTVAIFQGFFVFTDFLEILTSNFLFRIISNPIIIRMIPGVAFVSFDVNPETSTIQEIFPLNPKIVRINPPIKQAKPEIKGRRKLINS